jgi:large subunit ribosomal protein L22
MAQDVIAKLNNCGVSAQKVRLVINLVRGKPVNAALNIL